MPPRNRCRCGTGDTILVSMPIAADTFWHCGRRRRQQQSAVFCGIVPSKANVYHYGGTRMTRPRPVPRHPLALRQAASLLCWARERLFFYPRCQGMTRNTRCTFYASHTTAFLIHAQDFFLPFWTVPCTFRRENTTRSAVIAEVLLIAVAITSIENDVLATTFTAAVGNNFTNHGVEG
jgi:hypothetical protein